MTPSKTGTARPPLAAGNRSFWLKQLHQWHWISSAICLIGMLLFAATGITLNHAAQIEGSPRTAARTAMLPAALLEALPPTQGDVKRALPAPLRDWISREFGVTAGDREAEWSADEIYLPLPRPGGDAWINIDRQTGETRHEVTTRGWVSYLNDLHKGRNTGTAWSWFLDVFAIACFVFCLTGLFLLHMHAGGRPTTWPMVGLGLVVPVVLAILFIH
ncbi:PepSY-associated TM helix domain-containing protein [Roseococcus sp.]|uniref:PepSY-associated TM helix domain-containing protein n=1 Tax=Roseococcus sp. TaxID=2109646 RepID=UPI003BACE080